MDGICPSNQHDSDTAITIESEVTILQQGGTATIT